MIVLPFSPPRQLLKGILVNAQGQRYQNEDVYQSLSGEHALLRQDGRVWLIVDDAIFARSEEFEFALEVGETIEELAAEVGLPEECLAHTVETYNRHARCGEDPLFHKAAEWLQPLEAPPYAAIDLSPERFIYPAFTLGGLRTRPRGEVLTPAGTPVPGLFAAGRTTSGVPARGYNSGLSLADATFFGRLAGRSAAGG